MDQTNNWDRVGRDVPDSYQLYDLALSYIPLTKGYTVSVSALSPHGSGWVIATWDPISIEIL